MLRFVESTDRLYHDEYEWRCYCDGEVRIEWELSQALYDTDDPIDTSSPITSHWYVSCNNGHVLLRSHELADDETDNADPPTTQEIVEQLASPEDVAAWRARGPENERRLAEARAKWSA